MSQREYLIVLAHTHVCGLCRSRLLEDPIGTLVGRPLTSEQKAVLGELEFEHYLSPESLARAAGVTAAELESFREEAVVRLRHL